MKLSIDVIHPNPYNVRGYVDKNKLRELTKSIKINGFYFSFNFSLDVLSATISIIIGIIPYNAVLVLNIMVSGAVQGLIGGHICDIV